MRAAPAVDAALADGRAERLAVRMLHLLAALVLLAWLVTWLPVARPGGPRAAWAGSDGWRLACALAWLLAWLALGQWQARRWLPTGPCRLTWTGQHWHLQAAGQPLALAGVSVQIDLGGWLLLRLRPASPAMPDRWAVARAQAAGSQRHGLRVALRHHAGATPRAAADGAPASG